MRRNLIIDIIYILCFIALNIGLLGIYALNGPAFWDVFDNYGFLFTSLWLTTTIVYNIYVIKCLNLKIESIYQVLVLIFLPVAIVISWLLQKNFYDQYTGDTFLVFHPWLIISIFLYTAYFVLCFFVIFSRLKLNHKN